MLNSMSEKIHYDDIDDIPVLDLEVVKVELERKKPKVDTDFTDVQYAKWTKYAKKWTIRHPHIIPSTAKV